MSSPSKPWQQQPPPNSAPGSSYNINGRGCPHNTQTQPYMQSPLSQSNYAPASSLGGATAAASMTSSSQVLGSANTYGAYSGNFTPGTSYQTPSHANAAFPQSNPGWTNAGSLPQQSYQAPSFSSAYNNSSPFFNQMSSPYFASPSMGMSMGSPPPYLHSHFSWLQQLHSAVGAIGAITDLLGMNAEAFRHIIYGALSFIERVGVTIGEAIKFLQSTPPKDENGNFVIHPDEYRKQKRRKLLRIGVGILTILLAVVSLRKLLRSGSEVVNSSVNSASDSERSHRVFSWKKLLLATGALASGFGFGILYGKSTSIRKALINNTDIYNQDTHTVTRTDNGRPSWENNRAFGSNANSNEGAEVSSPTLKDYFENEAVQYDSDADSLTGSPEITRRLDASAVLQSLANRFSDFAKEDR